MKNIKYTKIIISFAAIMCLFVGSIIADDEASGGKGGAFLRIPIGARSAGMGNAFTGVADDVNGPYFNPAGLAQITNSRIGGMYNFMSLDRQNYQATIIMGNEKGGAVALTFTSFGVSDIIECVDGGPTGEKFDDTEMAFGLSAGAKILPIFSIGGTAKYINHTLYDKKGSGFAFDAGTMLLLNPLRIGASISNLGGKLTWDTDNEDEIPITMRVGSAIDFNLGVLNGLATFDVSQTEDNLKLHFGVETWLIKELCIRAGLDDKDINFGASLRMGKFQFDYAYCPDILGEGATSKLGVQLRL